MRENPPTPSSSSSRWDELGWSRESQKELDDRGRETCAVLSESSENRPKITLCRIEYTNSCFVFNKHYFLMLVRSILTILFIY